MNIIIVEDNKQISNAISVFLQKHDISTTICHNFHEAHNVLKTNHAFDCALIDWMLPDGDGTDLLDSLVKHNIPVIMMTAKGQIEDKIYAFDHGVRDYLVKPFDLRELYARIRTLIKHPQNDDKDSDKYLFDQSTLHVTINNKKIGLGHKEFLLAQYLFNHRPHIVSRTEILEYIWGEDAIRDNDNKLDAFISRIRKKIGQNVIVTVKGVGYYFDEGTSKQ